MRRPTHGESEKKARFSDRRVSDEQKLEQIIAASKVSVKICGTSEGKKEEKKWKRRCLYRRKKKKSDILVVAHVWPEGKIFRENGRESDLSLSLSLTQSKLSNKCLPTL